MHFWLPKYQKAALRFAFQDVCSCIRDFFGTATPCRLMPPDLIETIARIYLWDFPEYLNVFRPIASESSQTFKLGSASALMLLGLIRQQRLSGRVLSHFWHCGETRLQSKQTHSSDFPLSCKNIYLFTCRYASN